MRPYIERSSRGAELQQTHKCTIYLQDVRELALAIGYMSGTFPTQGYDTLLQVTERLVDVHTFFLYSLVRDSASFKSFLGEPQSKQQINLRGSYSV